MSAVPDVLYNIPWLDSCYYEVLLPGSPWHKIKETVNRKLAQQVNRLSLEEETTKGILVLLGQHFVSHYLQPNHDLPPLDMLRQSLTSHNATEAKHWLRAELSTIVDDLKLQGSYSTEADHESMSPVALEYMVFGQQVVFRGIERELHLVETGKKQASDNTLLLSGSQSEALGSAVTNILRKHPSRLRRVCQQLDGRQLPNTLRQLIWKLKIYKADKLTDATSVETWIKDMGKQFADAVEWGIRELGISNVTHSPVGGVIKHAVSEIYHSSPAIQDMHMMNVCSKMATEALNVLYVHNRAYEPHYALLLLPLMWTYMYDREESNEGTNSKDLPKLLFYLIKNCFPSRLQIFSAADHVISRLQREDKELCEHLCSAMQRNIDFYPREFLVNFIHMERERAMAVGKSLESLHDKDNSNMSADAISVLSHPIIFMRKWIGEGFAGVLDLPATLFVWDQCFLCDWGSTVLENICLVLLQLLRVQLLMAADYQAIKTVLLNQASRLYTRHIQQALTYLGNGGALIDVGNLRQPSQLSEVDQTTGAQSIAAGSPVPSATESAGSDGTINLGEFCVEQTLSEPATEPITNEESFDIYIDEVRFIPDNATVIKVTGRILGPLWRKPVTLDIPDIEAFTVLDSPARCPQFHFRHTVRILSPEGSIPTDTMLLLRIYTLDVVSAELLVIGNCAISLYKEQDGLHVLNTGGQQCRLKHQLPSTVSRLTEEVFSELTTVPAISVLVRILPNTEEFVESPGYASHYYDSSGFQPNESEWRLYRHYQTFEPYPPTVREAICDVREAEQQTDESAADEFMEQWYRRRMSKQQLEGQPAKAVELIEIVQYDQKQGMSIMVEQAFGLPNAQFVNVLIHTCEGPTGRSAGKTQEGYGGEEKALLKTRDYSSLQKSPQWIDEPKKFHPHYDTLSSLVIRFYSLDATYEPRADRAGPGSVTEKKGKQLVLVPLGWAVLPLFHKKSANAGLHQLPILQGAPSTTFMEFLSTHPGDISLREAIRQDIHQLQGTSSVIVRLWDGHFSREDCIPLPVKEELLSIGNPAKIKKTAQGTSGKPLSDLVLQALTRQERKQGKAGQPYDRERRLYEEAMNMVFSNLLEDVLLRLGLGPMD